MIRQLANLAGVPFRADSARTRLAAFHQTTTPTQVAPMRLVPSTAACSSLLALLAGLTLASRATAQSASTAQPIDAEYTAKIRELTPTDPKWRFTTELGTISGVADGADAAQGPRVRPRDGRETLARGGHQPVLPRRGGGGGAGARSSPLGMSDENREEFVLAAGERGDDPPAR